ncbi:hypothetical protein K3495_g5693 [Podosphaera aphanis]|nr:hypothetical protein K3495_g5693 [Podosphaera aphanis]
MTFKGLIDTAEPDGLVPTWLVFGTYPRMTDSSVPSPIVSHLSNAIRVAMKKLTYRNSSRKITHARRTRNGPSTTTLHDLPRNAPVMMWRARNMGQPKHWHRPFALLSLPDHETGTRNLRRGPTPFRRARVKACRAEPIKSITDTDTDS